MILFTLPGKLGDNLCKIPIIHQFSKTTDQPIHIAVDKAGTLVDLLSDKSLFPYIEHAFEYPGVQHYELGGQPWNFGGMEMLKPKYSKIYHLGYRRFPFSNLTISSWEQSCSDYPELSKLDRNLLVSESCINLEIPEKKGRVWIDASSSRPSANQAIKNIINSIQLPDTPIYINVPPNEQNERCYLDLVKNNKEAYMLPSYPLRSYLESLAASVLITTYSYASCLAYIAKIPQICLIDYTGLPHFESREKYYPGFNVFKTNELDKAQLALHRHY